MTDERLTTEEAAAEAQPEAPEEVGAEEPASPPRKLRPSDPPPAVAESLEQQLAEAEAKRDEYLADLQRMAADFDNFRKRVARDRDAVVARAHERLVRELLPVLDDLERALDAAEHHEEAEVLEGVRLVRDTLAQALEREGLSEIPTDGPFDPHVHEALLAQPIEGAQPGFVVEVIQRGYRLGDVVLRPARVIVAE